MLKAPPQPEKVLSEPTLDAVAEAIREGKCMHSNARKRATPHALTPALLLSLTLLSSVRVKAAR
jgi:hypothetical protein